jgi:uncharacterized protein YndB with AHSA1/START domain
MSDFDTTTRTVVVERNLRHPAEKVWRALTQGHLIEEWLMSNDFQPTVGHKFQLKTTPMPQWNGVLDCEVLEVETHKRLVYTWNSSGEEAANGLKTVVAWDLEPTGDGVLLRMEQSGFREDQARNFQGAQYGWAKNIERLEQVVQRLAA